MKRIILILICGFPLFPCFAQDSEFSGFKTKGFNKFIRLLCDTTLVNNEALEYVEKNSEVINGEVLQVVIDKDTITYSLITVKDESSYDVHTAMLGTAYEIVYEHKKVKNELCFLAGTYTYENKVNQVKTVPLYYTMDCLRYMTRVLIDTVMQAARVLRGGEETPK